jgi:peptidoglycan/LPS O-acetylase OafA/YrhL
MLALRIYSGWTPPAALRKLALPAFAILATFALTVQLDTPFMYFLGFPLVGTCAALIVADLVFNKSKIQSALEYPAAVWLGRVSYGLYIWHQPVNGWLKATGMHVGGLKYVGAVILKCLVSLGLTALSYYGIEKPFLRLKSRLKSR